MKIDFLEGMVKGWFVGDFDPAVLKTKDFEVAIKHYTAGYTESRHVHKVATEITALVYGSARMNDQIIRAGQIVTILPGESTDFTALEDCCTVVVKTPSLTADKFLI